MKTQSPNPAGPFFRHETIWVLLLLAVFILTNLSVAGITPTVGVDDAGYTDPAANLFFGNGFTSTMWGQEHHQFWCGNVPLYQGALFVAFKIFGFGLYQARIVNTLFAAGAAWLIWAALRRAALIQTPLWRLACLIFILSGSMTSLIFRTVRPDTTMFFASALVFFFSCWPRTVWARCLLAGLAATLLPAAGVPLLPYAVFFAAIWLLCLGPRRFMLFTSIGTGMAAGIGLLVLFYNHFSSFKNFISIVLPFTAIGGHGQGVPGRSMLSVKIWGETPDADNLFTCWFGRPNSFVEPKTLCDFSGVLLFLLFVILSARAFRRLDQPVRKKIFFVFVFMLVVPPLMHFAGHYRSMYHWMTYVPLSIALAWLLELEWPANLPLNLKLLCLPVLALAMCLGLPFRTLQALPQWKQRSLAPLEKVVAEVAETNDVVICDRKVWFTLMGHVKLIYLCNQPARGEFNRTVDLPTNEVSLLCIVPSDLPMVAGKVGTNWVHIPDAEMPGIDALRNNRYVVDFYRRSDASIAPR